MTTGVSTDSIARYRLEISNQLLDLNRRDRPELLAELDRMLAELPPEVEPAAELGAPDVVAQMLREAAGQPVRLPWRTRFRRSTWRFKLVLGLVTAAAVTIGWFVILTGRYTLEWGGVGAGPYAADEVRAAGEVEEAIYLYRPGRPVIFGFSVANYARFRSR